MHRSTTKCGALAVALALATTALVAPPAAAHGTCANHQYPVLRGEPGYSSDHDADNDGVGCENKPPRPSSTPAPAPSSAPAPAPAPAPAQVTAVGGASNAAGNGLWVGLNNGSVHTLGAATHHGDVDGKPLNAVIVGMAATADAAGYWLLGGDGGVFSYGNAVFRGSTGNLRLNQPVVSMASDPKSRGYWFVASDGGVFAFGAPFRGSATALPLNQPVVGMASTKTGEGYWLVARDGGVFSYGDAKFSGSTGSFRLNQPIVGMTADPDGIGYWLVGADGGVFAFDAPFAGSGVKRPPINRGVTESDLIPTNDTVTGIVAHPGFGYWLTTTRGGVFGFGAASITRSPLQSGISPLDSLRTVAHDTSPYSRKAWPHWVDADGDCQDTRDEVLIAESTVTVTLTSNGCDVVRGRWVDIYTGQVFTDPAQLDVDHMVPLANAHRTGGAAWSTTHKAAFANDDDALNAVSASANRSKGDASPDQWLPPNTASHCRYAAAWVKVKYDWNLGVTSAERTKLRQLLGSEDDCGGLVG